MNHLERMKARGKKLHDERILKKREGWIGPGGNQLTDKELIDKILKQYASAWRKLARL